MVAICTFACDALETLSCGVGLVCYDFVEAIRELQEPADVMWIGLSPHHLPAPNKRALCLIFGFMATPRIWRFLTRE